MKKIEEQQRKFAKSHPEANKKQQEDIHSKDMIPSMSPILSMAALHTHLLPVKKNSDYVLEGASVPDLVTLQEDGTLRLWEVDPVKIQYNFNIWRRLFGLRKSIPLRMEIKNGGKVCMCVCIHYVHMLMYSFVHSYIQNRRNFRRRS